MTLRQEIALIVFENVAYSIDVDDYLPDADKAIDKFIAHATQRLIDEGFEPGGKAIKAIEGMRDE